MLVPRSLRQRRGSSRLPYGEAELASLSVPEVCFHVNDVNDVNVTGRSITFMN